MTAQQSIGPARYALLAIAAATLALMRWVWQGTGNLWSKLDHAVYVADPDLGWRRTEETFTWLGLDIVVSLTLLGVALYIAMRLLATHRVKGGRWLIRGTRVLAVCSLLVPLYALASGAPPSGAEESMPITTVTSPARGITVSLPDLPSGRYHVVPHPQSAVVAKLEAGGEVFDARFAGGLEGHWEATPANLEMPMTVSVAVNAASIDTGIDLRDQHALEDLKPKEHPEIRFELTSLSSTEPQGDGIAFSAFGAVALGGRIHEVGVVGTLRPVDAAMAKKLSLQIGTHVLLRASFSLNLKQTIIGNDGTFDVDDVPISVTLILKHLENQS